MAAALAAAGAGGVVGVVGVVVGVVVVVVVEVVRVGVVVEVDDGAAAEAALVAVEAAVVRRSGGGGTLGDSGAGEYRERHDRGGQSRGVGGEMATHSPESKPVNEPDSARPCRAGVAGGCRAASGGCRAGVRRGSRRRQRLAEGADDGPDHEPRGDDQPEDREGAPVSWLTPRASALLAQCSAMHGIQRAGPPAHQAQHEAEEPERDQVLRATPIPCEPGRTGSR